MRLGINGKCMSIPLRVLIVEDSPDDAELLLRELRHGGFDPTFQRVDTAEGMMSALEDQTWDIVITDYVMPHFNGMAALNLLQEKGLDLPCIIVSGKIGEDAAVEAMRGGAHDYFVKGQLARLIPAIKRELVEARIRQERKRDEEILRQQLAAMESSLDGMATINRSGEFIYLNHAHAEIHGYDTPEELIGKTWKGLYEEREVRRFENEILPILCLNGKWRGEATGKKRNGTPFPEEISLALIEGGGIAYIVRDISERKEAEEKLRYMSTHDALTGLYNRAYFDEELARLEKGRQFPISIVMSDVDGLKAVNDKMGHAHGDALLKQAAKALKEVFRAEDVVARIGGDEFAALLPSTDAAAVKEIINRLKKSLAHHNEASSASSAPPLSLSVGVAIAENGEKLIDTWRLADARMYLDKRSRTSRSTTKGPQAEPPRKTKP